MSKNISHIITVYSYFLNKNKFSKIVESHITLELIYD